MKQAFANLSKKQWAYLVTALLLTLILGYFINDQVSPSNTKNCDSDLELIKPNIDCKVFDGQSEVLSALQSELDDSAQQYTLTRKANHIGVFVRDLNSSRFAAVNDNDTFVMASLLKLPLTIAGYKLAEVEPRILDQDIYYAGRPDAYADQNYKPEEMLTAKTHYTLKELLRRSIVYSDNVAAELVNNFYQPGYFDRILKALGIQFRLNDGSNENLVTARTYTNVLRALYNSSYLTPNYSNEVLEILTHTTYSKGIVAGLPKNTKVAHKFAERSFVDPHSGEVLKELHECGIVYAKNDSGSYAFCIMTEGKNWNDLEMIQQELSHEIYTSMTSGY